MTDAERERQEERLLVLAPTGKDASLARSVLDEAGIPCTICVGLEKLVAELDAGAAALLVAEEAIGDGDAPFLASAVARQPPWSDLPVLVLTRPGADSATVSQALRTLGNVTLLERPTRIGALVSAVRAALRARQRQYQIRAHLAERERAADALRVSDRRKDEFLAVLAHELRNPLAPIRNSLSILRLASREDPAASRVYGMMERQVNHMVRLVDDLMEVSRITRGNIQLRKERVELADVVASAVETSRPLIEAAGHQLEIALPEEALTLEGDPMRLAQVFANLLNNAAKYTDDGGRIWISAQRRDEQVSVAVRDSGIGIARDVMTGVFDMFTQADRGGRAQGGLGIGLTLVRSLVEMHGGTVRAHSDGPGQGSEFIVQLPLALATGVEDERPEVPAAAGGLSPRRVLVVDDNQDAADSMGMLLKFLGAEVQVVYDGEAALKAVEVYRPQVVLLDLGMPGVDGYEVAQRIREGPDGGDPTLIALTGWGQEEDRRRSEAAGFDYHIIKPADTNALQAILESLGKRSK